MTGTSEVNYDIPLSSMQNQRESYLFHVIETHGVKAIRKSERMIVHHEEE